MHVALTIADHLERARLLYPDRIGVVDEPDQPAAPAEDLTWRRIHQLARGQAAGLDALGFDRGDRVAIVSHNAARMLVSFFGVSAWGRVLVPINFRLTPDEIAFILEHSGARILLVDPELADSLSGVDAEHIHVLGSESDEVVFGTTAEPEPWAPDESATATINYTSGTTARPKGVQLTHRNLWLNAATFGWHVGVGPDDVYLHTLPMFHCNGWGMPYAVTAMGGRHIVQRKVDGRQILERIEAHGVTLMCGAPAVVAAVLAAADEWEGPIPGSGSVRIVVAGAPPPTSLIEQVETVLGWEFIQIYGLTETAPLLTISQTRSEWADLSPTDRAVRLGRAGAPALGVSLKVDESGEILARSNVVMGGYWEQPDATADAIRDGWFHTGDGGRLDEEHHVHIEDRKKDVIISGGENVSSIEVEDVLFGHPNIREVGVIGVPDEKWGETVLALVVLDDPTLDTSEADVIAYARDRLAHFKCPTRVEFTDELARTATGKLQKFKLRAPYWDGRDRLVN